MVLQVAIALIRQLIQPQGKHSSGGFGESPYATPTTYTYPLAYSVNALNVVIGSVGGRESTCRINSVSKDSFIAYRHYSGSGVGSGDLYWLAIGVQQWGNAGNSGGSVDVTFPISFTKTVYQIQLTNNNSSYENPTYAIKDTKSFSYWSKYGGDKLWFAIGMQQWGVYTTGTRNVTITLPIATSVTYVAIAVARTENNYGCSGSQNCQYVSNVTNKTLQAGSYDAGSGYAGFWWVAIGKA